MEAVLFLGNSDVAEVDLCLVVAAKRKVTKHGFIEAQNDKADVIESSHEGRGPRTHPSGVASCSPRRASATVLIWFAPVLLCFLCLLFPLFLLVPIISLSANLQEDARRFDTIFVRRGYHQLGLR